MQQNGDVSAVIEAELVLGERLLWAGRPGPGLRFERGDAVVPIGFFITLSLPCVLIWSSPGVLPEFWVPISLMFALPFALAGGFLGTRFYCARRRQRTSYGLTDNRIVISTKGSVTNVPLLTLGEFSLSAEREGRGTITLGPRPGRLPAPPSLEMIADAHSVYLMIHQARLHAARPAPLPTEIRSGP